MKSESKILLIVSGLIALVAFIAYFVLLPKIANTEYPSLRDFKNEMAAFLKTKEPNAPYLDIENSWPANAELTKIENYVPHYDKYNVDDVQALYDYSLTCTKSKNLKINPKLQKAWDWQIFICKKGKLPKDFFEKPPYIHPSGQSYSYLAAKESINAPKNLRTWVEIIDEEPKLRDYFIPTDWVHLSSIDKQSDIIFLERFALIRKESGYLNFRYVVYPLAGVHEFFSQPRPYLFVTNARKTNNTNCLENLERGCWALNTHFESGKKRVLNIGMLCAMGLSALLFLYLAFGVVKEKNEIKEDRNFIMRTLTHELRTPIAALSLDMESLRKLFNDIDEDSQKSLLRVFNSVERLKSLVQGSERYLSVDAGTLRKIKFNEKVNLLACVSQIVDTQNLEVEVSVPEELFVYGSEYWTKLCLQNLIQNALVHGKKPVSVKGYREDNDVYLDVIDQGTIKENLSTLAKPFSKDNNSKGLGLGLEIAQKAAFLSRAELKLVKTPNTVFRLSWRI